MSYSYKCYSDTKDFMKKFVNAEEGAIIYGMYLEDESHSYHISSLMDRKMKGEKLDGNLEKGFGMLRKDNQPQRARSSSLSSKG